MEVEQKGVYGSVWSATFYLLSCVYHYFFFFVTCTLCTRSHASTTNKVFKKGIKDILCARKRKKNQARQNKEKQAMQNVRVTTKQKEERRNGWKEGSSVAFFLCCLGLECGVNTCVYLVHLCTCVIPSPSLWLALYGHTHSKITNSKVDLFRTHKGRNSVGCEQKKKTIEDGG
jgi:hypothetical protein